MRYATGHAINLSQLFTTFNTRTGLITDVNSLEVLYKTRHKRDLAGKVLKACCKIIVEDIVENDVEFWLPTGKKKTSLKVYRKTPEEFKIARQRGAYQEVNFLTTDFAAYLLCLYLYGNRDIPKTKMVYLNPELKYRILEKINSGYVYYGRVIKTINDYYDQVFEEFPEIPLLDLVKIIKYGWRMIYFYNSAGADVIIEDNSFWFYIGNLYKDSIKYFAYYRRKLATKLSLLYSQKNREWDGYYYFSLTQSLYDEYLLTKKKRGRPRKKFKFHKVYLYKWYNICNILGTSCVCIMRVHLGYDIGNKKYKEDFEGECEVVLVRPPLTFKDILVENNDYL